MTRDQIMTDDQSGGGMFVVIPSVVMRDPALSLSAKMLYGVITWRCNTNACCWATNRALAAELDLSPKRVSALLSMLEEQGHIEIEIKRDPETNQIIRRNIYPMVKSARNVLPDEDTPTPENKDTPIPENEDTPPRKQGDPIPENAEEKYKEEIQRDNITPLTPQRGAARRSKYDLAEDAKPMLRAYTDGDPELAQLLAAFVTMRRDLRAINSRRAIAIQLETLDKLSGGDRAQKIALLKQSVGNSWKGIFPLKGGPGTRPEPEGLVVEQGPGVYDL